jgi:aminobenzoyl-glutamate transport protein
MMTAGYTPELAQLVFSAGSSIVYALTPAMAYFVIYVSYMEKYDKEGIGLTKCLGYCVPYCFAILIMWLIFIIAWTLVGLPLGLGISGIL